MRRPVSFAAVLAVILIGSLGSVYAMSNGPFPGGRVDELHGSEPLQVGDPVDLSINRLGVPESGIEGQPLTYTSTITNNSATSATGVQVIDTLPDEVKYNSGLSSSECAEVGNVVTCDIGELLGGASVEITIVVGINQNLPGSTLPGGTLIVNTAEVISEEDELQPDDNVAEVETVVFQGITSVRVTADSVEASTSGPGGPVTIASEVDFDLLELGGIQSVLGSAELEAGVKLQTLELVNSEVIVTQNGVPIVATLATDISFPGLSFDILEGFITVATMDFNLSKALVLNPQDPFNIRFRPQFINFELTREPIPPPALSAQRSITPQQTATLEVRVTDTTVAVDVPPTTQWALLVIGAAFGLLLMFRITRRKGIRPRGAI